MQLESLKWFGGLKNPSNKPEKTPTDDQLKEMVGRSTELFNALIDIASPFMVNDVLDLGRWEISSVTYFTPPIPISDKSHVNAELYHRVLVERARHVDLSGADGDEIGPENVTAELSIQVSEDQTLTPVIKLEGIRDKAGEITLTKVGLSDLTQEEAARDRLTRIKDIQKIAAGIKKYFDADPNIERTHKRAVTTVKDLGAVIQVSQK